MSWNSAKKRFQKDLEKLPRVLSDNYIKATNNYTLPTFENHMRPIPKAERKTKLQDIGFASGDVVYITEGEHKGKLSTVFNYSSELNSVLLSNVNEKKLIPKSYWVDNQTTHVMDYPKQVPLNQIKLAAKDRDDKGKVYYVVADEVIQKEKYYDPRYRKWLPKRFVKNHETIEIPWPNPPQEPKEDYLSTTENQAFEKTWELQSISKKPFPNEVLSQLRNPHSQYKKKLLSEVEARKLNAPSMPLSKEQQIYLSKQQQPKLPVRLSPEIQDFIGERIANRINTIKDDNLLAHLESLSSAEIPGFAKSLETIEKAEQGSNQV